MPARVWFLSIIIWSVWSASLTVSAQEVKAVTEWNLASEGSRAAVVKQLQEKAVTRRTMAWKRAAAEGWSPKGPGYELQAIEGDRIYIYHTMNVNAAISTAANLIRNTAPYNANGAGRTVGVWDEGAVRSTHQELTGRVTVKDSVATTDHATHVGGTIGAAGVTASALGMAPGVQIDSYDWNYDSVEMTARGMATAGESGKIQLSNHSYGTINGWEGTNWYGVWGQREDESFGQYDTTAQLWDTTCYNAPYYLPCKSAGNDRNDDALSAGTTFSYYLNGGWQSKTYDPATDPYSDGFDNGGFDTIGSDGTAKNILTVGAVSDAVSGGSRSLAGATLADFTSWGPTDDGRVKPDVVGNGVSLNSSYGTSDTAYYSSSGTSMSSPNVCGSVALLIDYYGQLFSNQYMRASTLKGLIIHTADDLGNVGPDYKFGWGLMNAKAAADLLKLHYDVPSALHLSESSISAAVTSRTNSFRWDGTSAIRATLCWTDPAGAIQSGLDNSTRVLVNDLDLRIVGPTGQVYSPYVLVPATPDAAATTGDNNIDNVEQVYIASPGTPGLYRAVVSLHGSLSGTNQPFSVILSGSATAVPSVTLSIGNTNLLEAAGSCIVTAKLSMVATQTVTVGLSFSGTATRTNDYTCATNIVIAAGSTTGTVTLTAVQDTLDETNEMIVVDITSVVNATESGVQQVTATILDDDFTVTFNAQGGTVSPTNTTVTPGLAYGTLPAPARTGYTFSAWWTGTNGMGSPVVSTTTVTAVSNHTLYAKWIYSVPFTEGFENGGSIPGDWSQEYVTGTIPWTFPTEGNQTLHPASVHGGSRFAYLNFNNFSAKKTKLVTPLIDLGATAQSAQLTFWHYMELWDSEQDELRVYYKTSAGGTWTLLATYTNSIASWTQQTVALPNPGRTYFIAFEGAAKYGYGVCIDDVYITASASITDTDGDAIPDSWEQLYFNGPTNATAGDDNDADGLNNLYEYIAGTNPTNKQSFFGVSLPGPTTGGVVIRWVPSISGRVYGVHWTTNLMTGFQPLETNILWPQDSFTNPTAVPCGYYKIKVELAK